MLRPRAVLIPAAFLFALGLPAQTVISTHSGVVYFFEGAVFLGDQRLEQKFGKFPDIGEGRELRTEQGRAEVLLTPGVMLRVADHSSIRMVSDQLSDTRVELLGGSAILETNQVSPDTAVTLLYKDWRVRAPQAGAYRIDAEPAQLRVYRGEADISAGTGDPVKVKDGENLPLAAVLVPQPTDTTGTDQFKTWAMNRSQAVSADNAIASGIVDDPARMDTASGLDAGGLTYFPITGVPSLGISNPYGVSFWSPYQPVLNSMYFGAYPYYGVWPTGVMIYPRPILLPGLIGTGRIGPGLITPRSPIIGSPRPIAPHPTTIAPRPAAPHVAGHR